MGYIVAGLHGYNGGRKLKSVEKKGVERVPTGKSRDPTPIGCGVLAGSGRGEKSCTVLYSVKECYTVLRIGWKAGLCQALKSTSERDEVAEFDIRSSRYEIGQVTVRGESRQRFSLPLDGGVQPVSVVFSPCLPRFLHFGPVYDSCTSCTGWVASLQGYKVTTRGERRMKQAEGCLAATAVTSTVLPRDFYHRPVTAFAAEDFLFFLGKAGN